MKKQKMLFKHPGRYKFDGEYFDFVVVKPTAVPAYMKRGWFQTKADALKNPIVRQRGRKRKFKELNPKEMQKIIKATGSIREIANRFNVSRYTVNKLKGNLS